MVNTVDQNLKYLIAFSISIIKMSNGEYYLVTCEFKDVHRSLMQSPDQVFKGQSVSQISFIMKVL